MLIFLIRYIKIYFNLQLVDGISVKSGAEDRSTSHITSVTTFVKGSSITHLSDGADEGGEEGEEEIVSQSLDVVLPAGLLDTV